MTEWDEPQAVIGSYLHRYAYPDWFARAREARARARGATPRARSGGAGCVQLRGEYLFVAEGAGGLRVYDVAIDRQQGRLAAHRHRAVLAAGPRHARRVDERDLRGAADQPADRAGAQPGRR